MIDLNSITQRWLRDVHKINVEVYAYISVNKRVVYRVQILECTDTEIKKKFIIYMSKVSL